MKITVGALRRAPVLVVPVLLLSSMAAAATPRAFERGRERPALERLPEERETSDAALARIGRSEPHARADEARAPNTPPAAEAIRRRAADAFDEGRRPGLTNEDKLRFDDFVGDGVTFHGDIREVVERLNDQIEKKRWEWGEEDGKPTSDVLTGATVDALNDEIVVGASSWVYNRGMYLDTQIRFVRLRRAGKRPTGLPPKGVILLDGKPLADARLKSWTRLIRAILKGEVTFDGNPEAAQADLEAQFLAIGQRDKRILPMSTRIGPHKIESVDQLAIQLELNGKYFYNTPIRRR